MRRDWFVARNNIYYKAHLSLEEIPTWIYILEGIVRWVCDKCSHKWLWWVHVYIHDPVFQLKWKKTKETRVDLPYKFLLETFPDKFEEGEYNQYINDPEEDERDKKRYRKFQNEDIELYEEFVKIYKKIQNRNSLDMTREFNDEEKRSDTQ